MVVLSDYLVHYGIAFDGITVADWLPVSNRGGDGQSGQLHGDFVFVDFAAFKCQVGVSSSARQCIEELSVGGEGDFHEFRAFAEGLWNDDGGGGEGWCCIRRIIGGDNIGSRARSGGNGSIGKGEAYLGLNGKYFQFCALEVVCREAAGGVGFQFYLYFGEQVLEADGHGVLGAGYGVGGYVFTGICSSFHRLSPQQVAGKVVGILALVCLYAESVKAIKGKAGFPGGVGVDVYVVAALRIIDGSAVEAARAAGGVVQILGVGSGGSATARYVFVDEEPYVYATGYLDAL